MNGKALAETRVFQWRRLRWYFPERKAAGKPYTLRLLYTGRTVMRLLDQQESLIKMIDRLNEDSRERSAGE